MNGLVQFCGDIAQRHFSLFSLGDVVEEDGDVPLLGPADSERVDVIEPAEGNGRILKPRGSRSEHSGRKSGTSAPRAPARSRASGVQRRCDAGLLLKGAIDVQKAVVKRVVRVIEQYLDHAETLVDTVEQRAVLLLGLAHLPVGGFEARRPASR
jgi:hypothetical protein